MARKPQFTRTKTTTTVKVVKVKFEDGGPVIAAETTIIVPYLVTEENPKISGQIRKELDSGFIYAGIENICCESYSMDLETFYRNAELVGKEEYADVGSYLKSAVNKKYGVQAGVKINE